MIPLVPDSQRKQRLIACALAAILILLSPVGWFLKSVALGLAVFLLGSYREAWITQDRFLRQFVCCFVPQPLKSWPLERFRAIETTHNRGVESESNLAGYNDWAIWQLVDWMAPWHFGKTRLRLRLENGKRVLAWQGMSEENYEDNLELLQEHTHLPVAGVDGTVSGEEWEEQQRARNKPEGPE